LFRYADDNPARFVDLTALELPPPGGYSQPPIQTCAVPYCIRRCLEDTFHVDPTQIAVVPNVLLPMVTGLVITSPGTIALPFDCRSFWRTRYLLLHEYYHVVGQWANGITYTRYFGGGLNPKTNHWEVQAWDFADAHADDFRKSIKKCRCGSE